MGREHVFNFKEFLLKNFIRKFKTFLNTQNCFEDAIIRRVGSLVCLIVMSCHLYFKALRCHLF